MQMGLLYEVEEEVKKLRMLQNNHVIPFIDSFYDESRFNLCVVLKMAKGGSLRNKLDTR